MAATTARHETPPPPPTYSLHDIGRMLFDMNIRLASRDEELLTQELELESFARKQHAFNQRLEETLAKLAARFKATKEPPDPPAAATTTRGWQIPPSLTQAPPCVVPEASSRLRLDPPRFDGENAPNWIRKVQEYYNHHYTPLPDRLYLTKYLFDHPASDWMAYWEETNKGDGWDDFLLAVKQRFDSDLYEDGTAAHGPSPWSPWQARDNRSSNHATSPPTQQHATSQATLPMSPATASLEDGGTLDVPSDETLEEIVKNGDESPQVLVLPDQHMASSSMTEDQPNFSPEFSDVIEAKVGVIDVPNFCEFRQPTTFEIGGIEDDTTLTTNGRRPIPPCNDALLLGRNSIMCWSALPPRTANASSFDSFQIGVAATADDSTKVLCAARQRCEQTYYTMSLDETNAYKFHKDEHGKDYGDSPDGAHCTPETIAVAAAMQMKRFEPNKATFVRLLYGGSQLRALGQGSVFIFDPGDFRSISTLRTSHSCSYFITHLEGKVDFDHGGVDRGLMPCPTRFVMPCPPSFSTSFNII